jgi:hypothetical protein
MESTIKDFGTSSHWKMVGKAKEYVLKGNQKTYTIIRRKVCSFIFCDGS